VSLFSSVSTDAHRIIQLESILSFITYNDHGPKICDAFRANLNNYSNLKLAIYSLENKFWVQSAVQTVSITLRVGGTVINPSRKSLVQSSLLSQYASPLTLVTLQVGALYYLDILLYIKPRYPSLETASRKIGSTIENMLQLQKNEVSASLQAYYGRVLEEGIAK
jgi:hypothetical protein